ncbi:MAG: hypothetical protein MUE44_24950 [Oscillatoriaceae cyanobacterium Prado104]|jgi:hypothetical protein|nr:hypothetical protein [Oscillatoriaceae cyanobacterium Prado104]
MDEFWEEFCNGIAGVLGELFARALFTKTGLKVAMYVLGLGIPFVYYGNLLMVESQAISIIKYQCRNSWSFYHKNARMSYTAINLGNNKTYNFGIVPTRYSNASIIVAQSLKSDFSNFVGIAFGPPTRNQGYACTICKSNSYSNRNISPILTNGILYCPSGYRQVEIIKP